VWEGKQERTTTKPITKQSNSPTESCRALVHRNDQREDIEALFGDMGMNEHNFNQFLDEDDRKQRKESVTRQKRQKATHLKERILSFIDSPRKHFEAELSEREAKEIAEQDSVWQFWLQRLQRLRAARDVDSLDETATHKETPEAGDREWTLTFDTLLDTDMELLKEEIRERSEELAEFVEHLQLNWREEEEERLFADDDDNDDT